MKIVMDLEKHREWMKEQEEELRLKNEEYSRRNRK